MEMDDLRTSVLKCLSVGNDRSNLSRCIVFGFFVDDTSIPDLDGCGKAVEEVSEAASLRLVYLSFTRPFEIFRKTTCLYAEGECVSSSVCVISAE